MITFTFNAEEAIPNGGIFAVWRDPTGQVEDEVDCYLALRISHEQTKKEGPDVLQERIKKAVQKMVDELNNG